MIPSLSRSGRTGRRSTPSRTHPGGTRMTSSWRTFISRTKVTCWRNLWKLSKRKRVISESLLPIGLLLIPGSTLHLQIRAKPSVPLQVSCPLTSTARGAMDQVTSVYPTPPRILPPKALACRASMFRLPWTRWLPGLLQATAAHWTPT